MFGGYVDLVTHGYIVSTLRWQWTARRILFTPPRGRKITTMGVINIEYDCEMDALGKLAQQLYEYGTPAEALARELGKAGALTFYAMMDRDVQNFWRGIAKQLLEHSCEWQENEGSCCVLSNRERKRLAELPRV